MKQAAEELGIEYKILKPIVDGQFIPQYPVALRLCRWMYGKKVFRKNRLVSEYQEKDSRAWAKRSVTLRTATWQSVDRLKKSVHGMSTSAFVDLCVTLVVQDNLLLTTLQKAADRLEEARVTQLLSENEALKELLRGDLRLAVESWKDNEIPEEEFIEHFPVETLTTREDFDEGWVKL